MAQHRLTPAVANATLAALATHAQNKTAASQALGMSRSTFNSRLQAARRMVGTQGVAEPIVVIPHVDPVAPALHYESAWQEWRHAIGQLKDRPVKFPSKKTRRRQKIVIASDFHIPFHHKGHVAHLFTKEADADLLIINGDLQDFYSVSRFIKYENVPIERELAEVTLFLEEAAKTWPRIVIVGGNHDAQRFEKQLRDRLDPEMVRVIEFLTGGSLSPIAAIAAKYKNISIAKTHVGRHVVSWLAQEGDLLTTHAEKFSITPGAALRKIEECLQDLDRVLNLAPWRVLIQAHTHQMAWFPWHAGRLLIEGGCFCETHGYQLTAKVGGRPQRCGYVTLEQVDGVTDIASIKLHWLDAE